MFMVGQNSFLTNAPLQRVLAQLSSQGIEARFVGGCVRNELLGVAQGDIDMACNVPPDILSNALDKQNIKVIPTGIDHGTITAIIGGQPIEITSLRKDMKTDGRHADVEFTDDWQEDARRRDFTMNALYVDRFGTLYDYVDGLKDLEAGRVRFIGDPGQRIQEDYLRILRFFRFSAYYSSGHFDHEGLQACATLKDGLKSISAERITQEFLKLWAAPRGYEAWETLNDLGILAVIFDEEADIEPYQTLSAWEKDREIAPSALRVCATLPYDQKILQSKLRLSSSFLNSVTLLRREPLTLSNLSLFEWVYRYGKALTQEALILCLARENQNPEPWLEKWEAMEMPSFPIGGKDLIELGIEPGPRLGELLKRTEAWWIQQLGAAERKDCLEFVKKNLDC